MTLGPSRRLCFIVVCHLPIIISGVWILISLHGIKSTALASSEKVTVLGTVPAEEEKATKMRTSDSSSIGNNGTVVPPFEMPLKVQLAKLLKSKNFMLLNLVVIANQGCMVFLGQVIFQMTCALGYPNEFMKVTFPMVVLLTTMLGLAVFSVVADKMGNSMVLYRASQVVNVVASFGFYFVITYRGEGKHLLLFAWMLIKQFFAHSCIALNYQLAIELTYPIWLGSWAIAQVYILSKILTKNFEIF